MVDDFIGLLLVNTQVQLLHPSLYCQSITGPTHQSLSYSHLGAIKSLQITLMCKCWDWGLYFISYWNNSRPNSFEMDTYLHRFQCFLLSQHVHVSAQTHRDRAGRSQKVIRGAFPALMSDVMWRVLIYLSSFLSAASPLLPAATGCYGTVVCRSREKREKERDESELQRFQVPIVTMQVGEDQLEAGPWQNSKVSVYITSALTQTSLL